MTTGNIGGPRPYKYRPPSVTKYEELTQKQKERFDSIKEGIRKKFVLEDEKFFHEFAMRELEAEFEADLRHPKIRETSLQHRQAKIMTSKNERLSVIESLALIFEPKKPEFINVTTESFGNFKLDTRILPKELKSVGKEWLAGIIAQKIEEGGKLYQEIMAGKKEGEGKDKVPKQWDVTNLMWFLQAKAENMDEGKNKVGVFTSGALSLEDPHLYLTNYLSKSEEIYQRDSSHIKEFQKKAENGVARGLDFNPGYFQEKDAHRYMNNVLPYDKGTLMISPMLKSTGLIEENRVLLKIEDYGCASPLFKDKSGGPISRNFEFSKDWSHVVGHAWKFLLSLWRTLTGSQHAEGTRKERVPPEIKNAYRKLIKKAEAEGVVFFTQSESIIFDELLKAKEGEILKRKKILEVDPFSNSGGIRIMYNRANYLRGILENTPKLSPDMLKEVRSFCEMLEKRYSKESLGLRIGDEVVLNQDDLKPQPSKNSSFHTGFL